MSEEPPSKGTIRSPIGGSITVASPFERQVGEIIVLKEGEQIFGREMEFVKEGTGPQDFCVFCIVHCMTPTEDAGKGATA